jgi:diguanylate cyclase (GGDEF)-like protein
MHRSPTRRAPRWTRSQLYPIVGLGFAALAGIAGLAVQSFTGGRAIYASLWLFLGGLLVLGGWLFGRQEDRLRRMSITDPLTGLANRRELEQRLEQELARASRHGVPLALLLIDVDHLKEINDRGGHRAGDRALLAVAEAMRGSARSIDTPARVGGDEFAILAPTTAARDAVPLAARVQATLRATLAEEGAPISVSIGIADLESAAELGADRDLLEAADRALYRAKTSGRDRVALHGVDGLVDTSAAGDDRHRSLRVLPGGVR